MIERSEIVPRMLNACPNAAAAWREHLDVWDRDEAGDFNDIAVFAHHVVNCYKVGDHTEVDAAFEQVEELITNGWSDVREVAIIGFLEDVQNIASHEPFGYTVFEPWLRPMSKQAWVELIQLWEGKDTLADVIRAEKRGE